MRNRLNQHSQLREQLETPLSVVENTASNTKKQVIDELRKRVNDASHYDDGKIGLVAYHLR